MARRLQTVIHHPTDSSLLTDGVRVLSRLIRRSKPLVQSALAEMRDAFRTRMRTMRQGVQVLHRLRRRQGDAVAAPRVAIYTRLVAATWATITQAEQVATALAQVGTAMQAQAGRLRTQLAQYVPLVKQVLDQTERRVCAGENVPAGEKLVSLFAPHTRIIPRHKGGSAVEFGRLVVIDEVEGGIVSRFAVLADKTGEQGQLVPALAPHRQLFGKVPRLVTGDRGLHTASKRGGSSNRRCEASGDPALRQTDAGAARTRTHTSVEATLPLAGRNRGAVEQFTAGLWAGQMSQLWGRRVDPTGRLGDYCQQSAAHRAAWSGSVAAKAVWRRMHGGRCRRSCLTKPFRSGN